MATDDTNSEKPTERWDELVPGALPNSIGPYRILEILGEGGMGIVYLAEQQKPLQRRVALKLIKLGMDTKEVIARFDAERQALALMNHPNIARVFEAGTAEGGRPYFVMEYVPGIPLISYCDRNRLTIRERLGLFLQVCGAVQHAHQRGIIHRDIKPSNVLVAVEDGKPVPKMIDFGIAKATNQKLTEKTIFTEHGLIIGTPAYMSPEQAEITNLDVGTTSDVYSLGALLYEILVGAGPFDSRVLREAGFDEMRRIIREDEPPKLTARLKGLEETMVEIVKRRRTDLTSLVRQIRGDLEWITLRAMEKDPTRRYASASEFAADIVRHLSDEPVLAGPPTVFYRLGKFTRKNRRTVAAASAVIVALMAGLVASTVLYLNARDARDEARWNGYVAALSAAQASIRENATSEAKRLLELCDPDMRGWEWSYLSFLADPSIDHLEPPKQSIERLAFTPDGQKIIGQAENELYTWDATTRKLLNVYRPLPETKAYPKERLLAFSPGGELVAATLVPDPAFPRIPTSLISRPISTEERIVRIRESSSGNLVSTLRAHQSMLSAAAFSPDSKYIVTATLRGIPSEHPRVWETVSGKVVRDLMDPRQDYSGRDAFSRPLGNLAFTRDQKRVVHGAPDHVVRLWDVISGELIQTFTGHENSIDSIAVSPDEMIIASASWDSIRIWHVPTGLAVHVFREDSPKYALAFSPKANFLAAASSKGIRIWLGIPTVASEDFLTYQGHASAIDALAFSPDGRLLISSDDHDVRLWEPDGPVPFRRKYTGGPIRAIAVNPIRSEVGLARLDANMVWDLSTGPLQVLRRGNYETNTLTFSPDGERMATGGRDRNRVVGDSIQGPEDSTVYLWDVASGKALAALSGHKNAVMVVRFTPEGKQIVSASLDKTVRIWEADGKALIRTLSGHSEGVSALAISPDGNIIATGSEDQTIRLWNRSTGALIRILATDIGRVRSLNFGADGRLLSGSSDTIHVWDVGSGTALAVLRADNSDITSVGWSPDQRRIVSASRDSVRLWDATRYEPVLVLRDESMVNEVAFLPSGKEIIAGTERGYALKWQAR